MINNLKLPIFCQNAPSKFVVAIQFETLVRDSFMSIALIFSGQGAQAIGMGQSLHDNSKAAQALYAQADQVLGWSLTEVSFRGPAEKLTETKVCQPALYVAGLAAVAALRESGKLPEVGACLGLSLGELTALCAAGVFDFATGLRIVAERGRLMQLACEQSKGAMAAIIGGDLAMVEQLAKDFDVDVANLNNPGQVVISGEDSKIREAAAAAKGRGAKMASVLNVAGAYHSRLMEPARAAFEKFLAPIEFKSPAIPAFTNVTGSRVSDPAEIKAMLVRQVVSSVRWETCMRSAAALGISEFYECGPGGVLAGMAKRTDKAWSVKACAEFTDCA